MNSQAFILTIDRFSTAVGKSFAWYILILTFGESYEVFVRYVLNDPTTWAYDVSYNMYGALFFIAGAYTLARNGHVRVDVVYRLIPQRVQAGIDLVLYIAFFFPGVIALVYAGWQYAAESWRYHEVSVFSPADIPIFPLKTLIPAGGVLLFVQGLAELTRCVVCLRDGQWPPRLHDVEELETAILHEQEALRERGSADAGAKP
ncbi:MAG TPA: TRAP transporter small permease subunit [Burkholderiales bacterium]|nr:TRAP transporter small permease subunit [Burkholderiales bacterium]